jgi:alcohol dehydrogenase class IV
MFCTRQKVILSAVLLPTVTRFSIPGATRRYAQLARSMDLAGDKGCDEVAAKKLVEGLEDLNQDSNIPRLGALKEITRECFADNVAKMAEDALDSGSPANNPVVPNIGEITTLYQSAY